MGQSLKALADRLMTPRAIAAAVLAAGCLVSLTLNMPGQLSYDSIAQLHDGHIGVYNSWHPPVMAWILGIADSVIPGAALFVVFDAILLYGAMLALLWLSAKPGWLVVPAALVCVSLPQFVLYPCIVWKDVLFANAAIAGFVCIAHAGKHWSRRTLRICLLAAGVALLVLATLARQNGAIALVFGIMAISALSVLHASSAGRYRAAFTFGGASAIGAAVLVFAASALLATRTPGESGPRAQLKLLESYDLIGAIKAAPALKLGHIARANPDLEQLMRTDGVRLYTPQRNDTMATSAELQGELSDTPQGVISAQWMALILQHPGLYLRVRARVFGWTFLTPDISRCSPFFVGVEGLPRYMRDLNLSTRVRPQDTALKSYGSLLAGTPVFSHVTFAFLALVTLAFLLRRRGPADLAMAFMLLSAFAFAASFFVISIACDYRYLVFLDLSALASALYLAASRPKSA